MPPSCDPHGIVTEWTTRPVYKGDTVKVEPPGETVSFWVMRKLDPKNNRIGFVPHDAAGSYAREVNRHMTYSRMQEYRARRVQITVIGEERLGTGDVPAPAA